MAFKLIFALALVMVASSKVLNVTCGACTTNTTCGANIMCFKYNGDGFAQEICSNLTSCTGVASNITYNIVPCTFDISGVQCNPQVCYSLASSTSVCIPNIASGNCLALTTNYSCGSCRNNASCPQCLLIGINSSGFTTNTESCTSGFASCTGITGSVVQGPCAGGVDSYGGSCSCCASGSFVGNAGYCASTDGKLSVVVGSNSNFATWGFEIKTSLSILFIVLVSILQIL